MPTKHTPMNTTKKSRTKTKKVSRKTAKKASARKSVKRTSATVSKKKDHQNWIDTIVSLGLLALAIEMAGFIWVGPGFTASVYNPLRQSGGSEVHESSSRAFTACERRAMRIRNQKRREQVLTICSERRHATSSSSSAASASSAPTLIDSNDNLLTPAN